MFQCFSLRVSVPGDWVVGFQVQGTACMAYGASIMSATNFSYTAPCCKDDVFLFANLSLCTGNGIGSAYIYSLSLDGRSAKSRRGWQCSFRIGSNHQPPRPDQIAISNDGLRFLKTDRSYRSWLQISEKLPDSSAVRH